MKTITFIGLAVLALVALALAEENKPEVVHIYYKTPEEAEMAQKKILEQYDALGGTTVVSDEGVPPVVPAASDAKPAVVAAEEKKEEKKEEKVVEKKD